MDNLYVLGHPVAHSKSPVMHNAAYRALGLDWEYGFADFADEDEAAAFIARREWLALNITMPYKPLAFGAASWRSEFAALAEGANVLVKRGDELLADNTDGKGCISYLRRCQARFEDARVVVCGSGPTSLSILHAARCAGAREVTLLGRDEARAQSVLERYSERVKVAGLVPASGLEFASGPESVSGPACGEVVAGSYGRCGDAVSSADIVIDATPLGMHPGDGAPFDVALLRPGQVVFDVVYGHGETALLAAARAAGCAAYDGAGMLVAQAVETVHDIVGFLALDVALDDVDLFAIMAQAAGFEL